MVPAVRNLTAGYLSALRELDRPGFVTVWDSHLYGDEERIITPQKKPPHLISQEKNIVAARNWTGLRVLQARLPGLGNLKQPSQP